MVNMGAPGQDRKRAREAASCGRGGDRASLGEPARLLTRSKPFRRGDDEGSDTPGSDGHGDGAVSHRVRLSTGGATCDGRVMSHPSASLLPALSAHTALLPTDVPAEGTWIQLLPAGEVRGRDGRGPYLVGDRAAMEAIVAATVERARATDLCVDYDHQAIFAAVPGVGGNAPAAGWIKDLQVRDDGIWGRVEWTTAAAERIRAGEYRYLSPVFKNDDAGRVRWLFNAGLVNTPNFELAPVAASDRGLIEEHDMKRIAAELGLGDDASEDAILARVRTITSTRDAVAAAVGLQAQSSAEALTAAIAAKIDPAKYVPIDMHLAVQSQLAELQRATKTAKATTAVEDAMKAGKIAPAMKDWALTYASADPAGFDAFVASAPAIVAPSRAGAVPPPAVADAALSDEDLQVQSQMGLSKDAFEAARKKEAV